MSEGSLIPFFIFLAIFIFSLLASRKKKETPDRVSRPVPIKSKPALPKPIVHTKTKPALPKQVLSYEVERKKQHSFLKKGWQGKGSLKQAFILSEILKKVDEREFF